MTTALTLLLMSGCSQYAPSLQDAGEYDDNANLGGIIGSVRLDVYPPQDNDVRGANGQLLDLRPQTFFAELTESNNDNYALTLTPSLPIGGHITGRSLTPQTNGDLPSTSGPLIDATVSFVLDSTVQVPRTTTDMDGLYEVPVIPSDVDYRMVIVPPTPLLPVYDHDLTIDGTKSTANIHIEPGVPLWGRVHRTEGTSMESVSVRAVNSMGVVSAPAITDGRGRFVIMVEPGRSYALEAERFPHVPTVRLTSIEVGEDGANADIPYANPVHGTVVGRIGSVSGSPPSDNDMRVTLRALQLNGYDGVQATHELELRTSDLVFTSVVPQGIYEVQISPVSVDRWAPTTVTTIEVFDNNITDIGQIDLPELSSRFGSVVDNSNEPVAGASITCAELGYAGRSWSTNTDPDGGFIITSPATSAMQCTIAPSADRRDLALTRITLDAEMVADSETRWTLVALQGALIQGHVTAVNATTRDEVTSDETIANAVVEVRNNAGLLLGITVTDADGAYSVRVAP